MEPAELAIRKAVEEVEKIGADFRLRTAVIILNAAMEIVAEVIDEKLSSNKNLQNVEKPKKSGG